MLRRAVAASFSWVITDAGAPTVTITTPTAAATHATGTSPLALGGTSTDNVAVTQVSWSNDRGGSGTATGTTRLDRERHRAAVGPERAHGDRA